MHYSGPFDDDAEDVAIDRLNANSLSNNALAASVVSLLNSSLSLRIFGNGAMSHTMSPAGGNGTVKSLMHAAVV